MVHEGPDPSDSSQGSLDSSVESVSPTEGAPGAAALAGAPPPSMEQRAPAKTPDAPSVRTTGPLLPMRIIGVNAVGSTASQTVAASVARPTPIAPAVTATDVSETLEAPKSQRPPASIPPPKPPSGRAPKNADETPLGGLEVAINRDGANLLDSANLLDGNVNNAFEFAPNLSLRAPPVPAELEDQIEISPESSQDLEISDTLVPSGPPPLPPERRTSGQIPKAPDEPTFEPESNDQAPPVPPVRLFQEEPESLQPESFNESPAEATDIEEPASVEVQEPHLAELDSDVSDGRPLAPQDGFTPGPRSDRSKPPALPSRPKRTDAEGKGLAEPLPSRPTHSAPTHSVPSQPAPPAPERGRQKKRRPPPIPPPRVAFTSGVEEETAKRRHWWEEVFGDDFLRANQELTERQLLREVEFIERSLNLEKPAAVLDLACGAGRHAVELNRRGYVTVGYDLSVTQLARASETAQAEGVRVSFLQGDMRDMAFDQMFDAVICWNASFGYFEEEKNVAVLKNIHRALKPGGCFLLDIPNRDFIVSHQPAQNWFEGDGCVCMDDMHVDFITSRLCVKRTIMLDDGRNKECLYSIRLFGLHELGRMLHEIGFRVNEVSGQIATRGVFMGATSPRLIITVTKR